MADRITYVGLDVHKEGIVVAAGGLRGEVREYGRIANTPMALARLLRKLGDDGVSLRLATRRGRAVRHPAAAIGNRARMRRRCPLADPQASG